MKRLTDPRVLVGATVAFLGPITLVWLSGTDMFIGWLLLILPLGWGLLGAYGILSSADALANAGEQVLAGEQNGCALMTTARIAIDESGWAYCPQGQPSSQPFDHVRGSLCSYSVD